MSSNLPDGVTESMIPGNRPRDIAAQQIAESIDTDELLEWIGNGDDDRPGCVIDEQHDGWTLESDTEPWLPDWPHRVVTARDGRTWSLLWFKTRDDALAYAITFHDDELIEALADERIEELAEDVY